MELQPQSLATSQALSSWLATTTVDLEPDILWNDEADQLPPAVLTYLLIALPLSLLLPIMANFAGSAYGGKVITGFAAPTWERLLVILMVELAIIPLSAGLAQLIGKFFQLQIHARQAYLIVTLGTVPIWLASLALAIPSLTALLSAGTLGIGISGLTLYRSSRRLLKLEEDALAVLFSGLLLVCCLPLWTAILALVLIN